MVICKNCKESINGNYCSNCGQPAAVKRIDGHYIMHEIEHVLHLERGIFYTVRELVVKPGEAIRHYLNEGRTRLVKPIIFIIITSLIYTVTVHFFHLEDGYINIEGTPTANALNAWIRAHYGYGNILIGVSIALWLRLFFAKKGYNFFEILILLCFILGTFMLIISLFALVKGITNIQVLGTAAGAVGFAYITWAIGQFFGEKKIVNYVKAFGAYLLGVFSFSASILLIGALIDWVIK